MFFHVSAHRIVWVFNGGSFPYELTVPKHPALLQIWRHPYFFILLDITQWLPWPVQFPYPKHLLGCSHLSVAMSMKGQTGRSWSSGFPQRRQSYVSLRDWVQAPCLWISLGWLPCKVIVKETKQENLEQNTLGEFSFPLLCGHLVLINSNSALHIHQTLASIQHFPFLLSLTPYTLQRGASSEG